MLRFQAARQTVSFTKRKLKSNVMAADGPRKRHGHHWEGPGPHGQTFRAGEIVLESGIYEAIHKAGHREPHEVVMVENDLFPPCDTCAQEVRFKLIRTAPYIFTDEDFEKP